MKQRILTIIFLFFAITLQKTAANEQLIVPGKSIGLISIGMKETEMLQLLGEPESTPKRNMGFIEYRYLKSHLLIAEVDEKTKTVVSIATGIQPKYKTPQGIAAGTSLEALHKVLGMKKLTELENGTYLIDYPEKGIEYIVIDKNGKIEVYTICVKPVKK